MQRILHRCFLEHRFCQQLFELGILRFQFPQTLGFTHVHATVLRLPTIKRAVGNTVFTDYLTGWNTGFMLFEDSNDLLLRVGLALHIDFSLGSI